MSNRRFLYTAIVSVTTVINVFAILCILFPFLAHQVQNLSPLVYVFIYLDHLQFTTIACSVLLAFPIIYVLSRRFRTHKAQLIVIGFQLVLLTSLVVIVYFNLDYLNEIMFRPTYE